MNDLFAQALKEREQGNLSQAEQLFVKIVAEGQSLEDVPLQEQCLEQLVEISRLQQETHNTLRWLKKQYTLAKKYNVKRASELCVEIAHVCYQRQDFEEGKSWARKGFERAQAEWYRDLMAESQLLIGMILYKEQRMDDARIFFRRSYSLYDELKNNDGVYKALFHMGLVRHALDNLVKARSIFLECLERTAEEDTAIIADLHLRLALITQKLEMPVDTLFHSLTSLMHYRALRSPRTEMVWRVLFLVQDTLGQEQFQQHLDLHFDEQEYKKFLFLFSEARKRHQEKNPPSTSSARSEESTVKIHPSSKEPTKPQEKTLETTTQKIIPTPKESSPPEAPPPKRKPFVVEIDIPEEEVFEDSVDSEPTWKEPPTTKGNSQVIQLVLLFIGVFVGVSLSLYLINQLK